MLLAGTQHYSKKMKPGYSGTYISEIGKIDTGITSLLWISYGRVTIRQENKRKREELLC